MNRASSHDWTRPVLMVRWALVVMLLAVLFFFGVYDETIYIFIGKMWVKVFNGLGLDMPAAFQQGLHRRVTRRPLLPVATYAALYVLLCLCLLRLLLATRAQWRLTLRLYTGVAAAYLVIAVAGKLAGDAIWAYRLSRHLIDFVVSPIPVAGLLVLFRAGFGPAEGPINR